MSFPLDFIEETCRCEGAQRLTVKRNPDPQDREPRLDLDGIDLHADTLEAQRGGKSAEASTNDENLPN